MRKRYLIAALCMMPALAVAEASSGTDATIGARAERTVFAKSIEDLPVMPGLEVKEEKDLLVIFGSRRIARATLEGPVDIDKVYYYYEAVLPSLGWKKITSKKYERDGEELTMAPSSVTSRGTTVLRFEIEPVK